MSITFYGALQLAQISLDEPGGPSWINTRNQDAVKISDMFSTNTFTPGALVFINATGKLAQSTSELFWDTANKILRVGKSGAGVEFVSQAMAGLELTAGSMNDTVNQFGYGIKFVSTDSNFTTTNPKFLAGFIPRATQGYTLNTHGGMVIDVFATPNTPGAAPTPALSGSFSPFGLILGGSALHESAILQLNSSSQGLLVSRLTTAEQNAIPSLINGLIIYNSSTNKLRVVSSGAWIDLH